jgi:hypothetical protein
MTYLLQRIAGEARHSSPSQDERESATETTPFSPIACIVKGGGWSKSGVPRLFCGEEAFYEQCTMAKTLNNSVDLQKETGDSLTGAPMRNLAFEKGRAEA